MVDTSSDLLWVQCQPCITCFNQSDNLEFDPKKSSSYIETPCSFTLCNHDESYILTCDATVDGTSNVIAGSNITMLMVRLLLGK